MSWAYRNTKISFLYLKDTFKNKIRIRRMLKTQDQGSSSRFHAAIRFAPVLKELRHSSWILKSLA